MKNKKGFTLIELLAVIAILSILLIIAIPGVLEMFNKAKKNTFVDQAESIYNTATKQFMSDQLEADKIGSDGITYCWDGEDDSMALELSGNKKTLYYVHFTAAGVVDTFKVADDDFGITGSTDVDVNDVKDATVLTDSSIPSISCN